MDILPSKILTDVELESIEAIVSQGVMTLCSGIHPEVDLLDDVLRTAGFVAYASLPDFRSRRPYERSLWVQMPSGRCVPELYALAAVKYGPLSRDVTARWTDGCSLNKTLENVSLVTQKPAGAGDARVKGNRYGVQAGTPEYRKKYYADPKNRERQKEHARKSAAKKRGAVQQAKGAIVPDELQTLIDQMMPPDGRVGDDEERLTRALEAQQQPQVHGEAHDDEEGTSSE